MQIQYVLTKAEWDDYHEANHILAKIKAILATSGIYNHELSIPAMTMYLVVKNDELNAAHKTLKEVTDQRDGLRSGIDCASDQLTRVTEQRDRLAEALRVINTYDPKNGQCDDGYTPVFHARKALAAVKGVEHE